jgi:hypothetical protein
VTFRNGSTLEHHALIMSHFDPTHVDPSGEMDVITLALTVLAATHFKKKKYHRKPQHLSISTEQSSHDEVLPKQQVAMVRKEGMKKKKALRRKETIEIFPDHSQEKSNPNRFCMTAI